MARPRHRTPGLTVFLALVLLVPAAYADGTVDDAVIVGAIDAYNRHGRFQVPPLSADHIAALVHREPVVVQLDEDADAGGNGTRSMAFVGAKVFDAPRLLVWLTALGGNNDYRSARGKDEKSAGRAGKSRVTHAMLSRNDDGSYVRYQHVRLPWPFKDRHWAVYCRKNVAAAELSDDGVWEHFWTLEENGFEQVSVAAASGAVTGVTEKMLKKSVYLPANEGAWITIALNEETTLLLAYLDVDLGGSFPKALVRGFTQRQLKAGLNALPGYVARVADEYTEEPPIHDGAASPISRDDALDAAARWHAGDTVEPGDTAHP